MGCLNQGSAGRMVVEGENSGSNCAAGRWDGCVIDLASCKKGLKASWTHAEMETLLILICLFTKVQAAADCLNQSQVI